MNPKSIVTGSPFKDLFRIFPKILGVVTADMSDYGYDRAFPIILGKRKGSNGPVVIDGHTRLKAALDEGLEDVPVITNQFEAEDDALEYAIHNQRDRRNLTEDEILACIAAMRKKKKAGRPSKELASNEANLRSGKSAQHAADILDLVAKPHKRFMTIMIQAIWMKASYIQAWCSYRTTMRRKFPNQLKVLSTVYRLLYRSQSRSSCRL